MSDVCQTTSRKIGREGSRTVFRSVVIAWLRTRLSFEILRAVHMSVRGTRLPPRRKQFEVVDDFILNVATAGIF